MRVIAGSEADQTRFEDAVVTIGNFDGVHIGHVAILGTVVERARALGAEAVALTFDPHPRKVLQPDAAPALLTTLEQKLELFERAGLDAVVLERFTLDFSRTPPEVFIRERLHERLRPLEVYVGYDFHFGHDRLGSMRLLTEKGPQLGFAVTIIPEVRVGTGDVNSSRIRERLAEGAIEDVSVMLGRAYSVRGRVVEGDRRGREIGFATANLASENELLPAAGVYAGDLTLLDPGSPDAGERLSVVTNVGHRPTFPSATGLLAEAHAIDWEGDLYGRRVEISFRRRLREERKFDGIDALRAQIAADVDEARRLLISD
ncbi:MAG: bifunctional riboflavin kinase/FAD synthetase [Myxococcales bacterium]|nr:bifunctional riboflavin kinase/FAD synthetase [Myxococcales bacterium]